MVDDRAFGAGSPADTARDGFWRGDDRGAQFTGSDPVFVSDMENPAHGLFYSDRSACCAHGVSADSVGGRGGGRLWPWPGFSMGAGTPAKFFVARGCGTGGGVRDSARGEYLRRSFTLAGSEIRRVHRAFVPEH